MNSSASGDPVPARMTYFKCVRCKIRVSSAELGSDLMPASTCPNCGTGLQPVRRLAEVIGFRSPGLDERLRPEHVARRLAAIVARRDAPDRRSKREDR